MQKSVVIEYFLIISIVFIFGSCTKEKEQLIKENLTGYVQKGPFINGTPLALYELDENMIQTGRSFNTQIIDNSGTFEIPAIELSSPYAELKADGFYYNEVLGETSSAQLTLYALTDLSNRDNVNINVLTNLEKRRVEYLISSGVSFNDAKDQAQQEILGLFEIDKDDIEVSEALDIAKEGEDNAILLAISTILQGYRSVAELSELLATISTDIREDGVLDNPETGSALINHSKCLNIGRIKENLEKRYQELGIQAVLPDFEKYIVNFNENTDFEFTYLIKYPEFSEYGQNILFPDLDTVYTNGNYSLAAEPPTGTELKIILSGNIWSYQVMPNGPINWTISRYDEIYRSQVFEATESGKKCDLIIWLADATPKSKINVEYFENGSVDPNWVKEITIAVWKPPVFVYPDLLGKNILVKNGHDSAFVDEPYAMRVELPVHSKLTLTMQGAGWNISYPFNWIITPYDNDNQIQIFTTADDVSYAELSIMFTQPGTFHLYYKEEGNGGVKEFDKPLYVFTYQ